MSRVSFSGARKLRYPASVVGDGPEGIHCQDVGCRHQHAHGGNRRPVDAADKFGRNLQAQFGYCLDAEEVGSTQRSAEYQHRQCGGLEPNCDSGDDQGGRAGARGLGDVADRPPFTGCVVLSDVVEEDRSHDSGGPGGQQPDAAEHVQGDHCQPGDREHGGCPESDVQISLGARNSPSANRQQADHRGQDSDRSNH